MGFIADLYPIEQTTPVMTDAYHFTTAYAYWLEGRADNPSISYMFGRKEALNGGYTIAGGLEGVIDIVQRWQEHGFTEDDLEFIRSQKTPSGKQKYPEEFIDYLSKMEFKLKIDAIPEGTAFFPQEPVLRVQGPLAQVKMLESIALGLINGHSGYITQGARQSDVLAEELENGAPKGTASVQNLRRGPSLGASIESSRSLGAGGYTSTSTGVAARELGQVFAGTMDHAWVMTHSSELGDVTLKQLFQLQEEGRTKELQQALCKDAFRSFSFAHSESGILLLDTRDPLVGLENAITTIKELRELGMGQGYGVRFDSGDLVKYSKVALRRFAEEGFITDLDPAKVKDMSDAELLKHSDKCTVFCAAADGIDEHSAKAMREMGAFYKSYGIGTAGAHIQPVGLVYKAAAVYMEILEEGQVPAESEYTKVMKIASNAPVKSSNPGKINSQRFYGEDGKLSHVVIYDEIVGLHPEGKRINLRDFNEVQTSLEKGQDVLVPVFDANGNYVFKEPAKKESRPGSGHMVTDLGKLADFVHDQLDTLPDNVRMVVEPRDAVLARLLVQEFARAEAKGEDLMSIDIAEFKAKLPPKVGHIPVYIDANLFEQRKACEHEHLTGEKLNTTGVGEYIERFAGGPGSDIKGDLKSAGGPGKQAKIG